MLHLQKHPKTFTAYPSQYWANSRPGHLEAVHHVFGYLKKHDKMGRLAYNPVMPKIDESMFNDNADWTDFYSEVKEELPLNMPKPR